MTFNNTVYSIPANREQRGWGSSLSSFLVDVANSSLSKAGGSFTLTADANFGSNYGLVVKYIKSVSSNIAASGVVRLANTDKVAFRNNANGADLELGVSSGDRLQFGGVNVPTISSTDTLTNKTIAAGSNTITGLAKSDVGLGNVDNTSDSTKNSASATLTNKTFGDSVVFTNISTPSTPSAGTGRFYFKSDKPAYLDSSGNERIVANTTDSLSNPMTTSGDVIYGGSSGVATRLAGNTSAEPAYLRQTGNGSVSAAPVWQKASDLSKIRLNTGNGHGSTNTKVRRFTTQVVNSGTGITYADSATLGATFTCTEAGIYAFEYADAFSGVNDLGLSLNSAQLTTNVGSITAADRLCHATTGAADYFACVSVTIALAVGDVVRAHTSGGAESSVPGRVSFTCQRIA